jgi:hypothetical protein
MHTYKSSVTISIESSLPESQTEDIACLLSTSVVNQQPSGHCSIVQIGDLEMSWRFIFYLLHTSVDWFLEDVHDTWTVQEAWSLLESYFQ